MGPVEQAFRARLRAPVILRPPRREYTAMQNRVTELILSGRKVTNATPRHQDPNAVFEDFLTRLRGVPGKSSIYRPSGPKRQGHNSPYRK